jgi:hypothetical protein
MLLAKQFIAGCQSQQQIIREAKLKCSLQRHGLEELYNS